MNPDVEIVKSEVLSDNWYVLRKFTFKIRKRDGTWDTQMRECYDRGNGATVLLYDRRLLIFAAAMVTFHLANAAMLPLVGQVLALRNTDVGTALMATCIVAAQVVMVPMAYLAGAKADSWDGSRSLSSDSPS